MSRPYAACLCGFLAGIAWGEEKPKERFREVAGRHSIEVKVVSQHPELLRSVVLSDGDIQVNK